MATALEEPKVHESQNRSAAEWGLASLLLVGLLAVMAMLMLQINLQMYFSPRAWPLGDVSPIFYVAILATVVLFFLTTISIAFGIRSLVIAYKSGQPCALGWAGTLMSTLALFVWTGTLVDLFSVLDMLMGHGLQQLFR